MRYNGSKRVLSALLVAVMMLGLLPAMTIDSHAAFCPECNEQTDGAPYCSECYTCNQCRDMCIECGLCIDCSGSEICEGCSQEEVGDTICLECAIDKGQHCSNCDACYFTTGPWCEECGKCDDCVDICQGCTAYLGNGILCVECAAEGEGHCPECGGCYFEIQGWCEECMLCAECITICEYCCAEAGMVICADCASAEGMHCPDCNECYGEVNGDYCTECYTCLGCMEICPSHELCIECAIGEGVHCQNCEACDEEVVICEECGEVCSACASEMCENCNLCDGCVEICPDCGACSNCADICEECGEHCSQCEGICDDCNRCMVCCKDYAYFEGCDCEDWVCVEHDSWAEHLAENHTEPGDGHFARAAAVWSWSSTHHWHDCVYCDDPAHYTGKAAHTYDSYHTCTVCGYSENAKIMIYEQPREYRNVYVTSPDEAYDERNIAHFSVKAKGESELSYVWCREYYSGGKVTYQPLSEIWDPQEGECYEGPDLYVVVPTDACCDPLTICCVITDEAGNQVRTVSVPLKAKHDYHYYELWKTHEWPFGAASTGMYGHVLQCVGECCDNELTGLRPHEDEDKDRKCDICDYNITGILVSKQPKDVKNVFVSSSEEDYDESNIARFRVEASGESELTYTWCRRMYSGGKLVYSPLTNPGRGEVYDGPELAIVAPEDACVNEYTYACFITDEEGNEVKTVDVKLKAKHNYQYFKDYQYTRENVYGEARSRWNGHILQCVSNECGKVTRLRAHVDEDNDYCCDICDLQKHIGEVSITVTAPVEGKTPSYTVNCDSPAYGAVGSMNNGRYWFVSDNGVDNWQLIDNDHTFLAGKHYKFRVDLRTAGEREFPIITYNNGTFEYNLWAKVNGNYTKPQKTDDQEPKKYLTLEYIFGECNDSVIENIVIDGVTEPVAGQKPTYSAFIRGSGYYIDTNKNASYDAYWKNPPEMWPYIKNGIGWFDLTKGDWVYDHETFIPGHQYEACVYIKTEEGYTFWHDKWMEMLFTASINGVGAEGNTTGSSGLTEQRIAAAFTCQPQEITTVMVYDLDVPVAGKTPDYTVTTAYPEIYRLDPVYGGTGGVIWYDSEGTQMDATDTFVEGEQYRVEIKVIPTQLNGANVCKFTSPVSAYIDGKQVTQQGDWDMVYASDSACYVYYTFPNGTSAPADIPKFFVTQPQGTTVGQKRQYTARWKTSFIPEMTEIQYWDGQAWDQWDVQYPEQAADSYTFVNPEEGSCMMKFRLAAYLGGTVAAYSHNFTITWGEVVSSSWSDSGCEVSLETVGSGVSVLVVSYEAGKMVKAEYLTVSDPSALLTGDNVKVLILDDTTYAPCCAAAEIKP